MTTDGLNVISAFIDKHTVPQDGIVHEPVCVLSTFYNYIGRFLSFGTTRTSLSVNNTPFSVRATVLSCISGFCGRRRRNSQFICTSVRTQLSLIIFLIQSRISSSTRMLFLPPRGNSWIRPSLIKRATIPRAVDRLTPNVSATSK